MPEDYIDKFLRVPKEKRGNSRNFLGKSGFKKRGKYRKSNKDISKEEIIEYIKTYNIRTRKQLEDKRKEDNDAPTLYFITKLFGSWEKAKRIAFDIVKIEFERSDETILNFIMDSKIFTADEYRKCRKKCPSLFPSFYEIERRFGSWNNCKKLSLAFSKGSILERLWLLYKKLGKFPTKRECYDAGVEINRLLDVMDKNQIKSFIEIFRGIDNEK